MSKVPMKRLFLCGLKKNRKQILETLQRAGVVEVTGCDPEDGLETMDVAAQRQVFDRNSDLLESALATLASYEPDPEGGLLASLEGPKEIGLSDYEKKTDGCAASVEAASRIQSLAKEIAENRAAIPKAETRLEALTPWMGFDLPFDFSGTKDTAALIGSFPEKMTLEDVYAAAAAGAPNAEGVDVSIVSASDTLTCIFVLCLKRDAEAVEAALKQRGFARAQLSSKVPAEEAAALRQEIKDTQQRIDGCIDEIRSYAEKSSELKFAADYYAMRADKYEVLGEIGQTGQTFFIEGYVPAAYADALSDKLNRSFDMFLEISDPPEDDDIPIALQNGVFADPMETVVESYSLPSKNEFDPSKIMAPFYYLFFGMMLSDAGYGLLLVFATAFVLLKVKNLKPGMKKMMKLFFYSGISTVFWGVMFGSFFGDAVSVIATTFFNRPDVTLKPLWFEPVSEPMRLLVFAFALGILHLFTGLGIKGIELVRDKQYKDAVYDVLFWYMFVGGGIIYLLTMEMITGMMGLSFTLSPVAGKIAAVVMAVGGIGVVLTGGRESKNWFKRFLKGLYSAYGITSYLSDILSYSRLLALGLATGVIAQVFNKMGSMLGATWYGILIFVLVFLIGHVLNLGINVLGAYVHTNRLQFVEFFGKFYEGGGRPFTPFTENTKYYKVKEEI